MDEHDVESFVAQFRVQIGTLRDLFTRHVYPPFADPDAVAWQEMRRLRDEFDLEDVVPRATELFEMKTILINLFAAGLFHQFEQQLVVLIEHQFIDPRLQKRLDANWPTIKPKATKKLKSKGIRNDFARWSKSTLRLDPRGFPQWNRICELNLVANVVKHAEGRSADDLRKIRPELFDHPMMRQPEYQDLEPTDLSTRHPLAGADFYVDKPDFDEYASVLDEFWVWFEARVKADPPPHNETEPVPF